jgi:integrase
MPADRQFRRRRADSLAYARQPRSPKPATGLLQLLLLSRDLQSQCRDLRLGSLSTANGLSRDVALLRDDLQLADGRRRTLPGGDVEPPCRDLQLLEHGPQDGAARAPLPGFEAPAGGEKRGRSRRIASRRGTCLRDDRLQTIYLKRLRAQGAAEKGVCAYRYQLQCTLAAASHLCGRTVICAELFRDAQLLGRALVHDATPVQGTQASRWTLAQRRSAIRSFAKLMRPELIMFLGEDPNDLVDRALQAVAERVGTGYRLTGGAPRRCGARAPTQAEVTLVLEALGQETGYLGLRNRAFFTILVATGARVNALRDLDGADCVEIPSGRLRIFLHEKGKAEAREIELSYHASNALHSFAEAYNYIAAVRGWRPRVRIGQPGAVWRNSSRGRWSYNDVRATLRSACATVAVQPFTPHALRRAFATDAASLLPRHTVALAGGWKGLQRLDDHYIHPRQSLIWDKLARTSQPQASETCSKGVDTATVLP